MIEFNLKKVVKESGLTMQELAKKSDISRTALSNLATGKSQGIQFDTLDRICKILLQSHFLKNRYKGEEKIINALITFKQERKGYTFLGYYPLNANIDNDAIFQNDYLLVFEQKLLGASVIGTRILRLRFDKENDPKQEYLNADIFEANGTNKYNQVVAEKLTNSAHEYIGVSDEMGNNYFAGYSVRMVQNFMINLLLSIFKDDRFAPETFKILIQVSLWRNSLEKEENQALNNFIQKHSNYPRKEDHWRYPSDTWDLTFQVTQKSKNVQIKPVSYEVYFNDPKDTTYIKKNVDFKKFKKLEP